METYVKTTHKPIKEYYDNIQTYIHQDAEHEGAISQAFFRLLEDTGKRRGWHPIGQKTIKGLKGKNIRPDAVFQNDFLLEQGYWEAKDIKDRLDIEIGRKIDAGYPTSNIIFEDSHFAVLIQDGDETMRVDMREDPDGLVDMLNYFFNYAAPAIQQFERAIADFQDKIPQLAKGLQEKIDAAKQTNKTFQAKFNDFFTLARDALNPNLRIEAVDEMIIQHLLTERLFRTVFNNPDFVRRNVIAREIETVIDALTSQHFNRANFLGQLDQFYQAIEAAAEEQRDFSQKQAFLNTVYERFFQGYSVKKADTHGIVYTPQPIVDFMCASVEEVLKTEFGRSLGDEWVHILDPATGTGNFIVNLLRRIPKHQLDDAYRHRLFANEVMLLPYYIASLNIEHEYYDLTGKYAPFEGIALVDTLDLKEEKQPGLGFFTEENTERIKREKEAAITVIIGNPPYNAKQLNENDNNKNRVYRGEKVKVIPDGTARGGEIKSNLGVDDRIEATYSTDSRATNKNTLYDMYVRFFRWATDRLQGRDGIVCFVTNNNFLDDKPFDGMRKHLFNDFELIYVLDLQGNIRKYSMRDGIPMGEEHTVFGLGAMVGIAITVLVKKSSLKHHKLNYHSVDIRATRAEKFRLLENTTSVADVDWDEITPDERHTWLVPDNDDEFSQFIPMGDKETKGKARSETIFSLFSNGVKTNRDMQVYDFDRDALLKRVETFIDGYNAEVDRYKRYAKDMSAYEIDDFVRYEGVKWSEGLKNALQRGVGISFISDETREATYRPFTKKHLYFNDILCERRYQFPRILPNIRSEEENKVICCTNHSQLPFLVQITHCIPDTAVGGRPGQCFPFYVYDEDGGNRRENITDWALEQFREEYDDESITKWDIFYYVYGLLHHPGYRERYADSLKRDLPRIPFAPDFRAFSEAGQQLADLHLNYEDAQPYPVEWVWKDDAPVDWRVEKMRLRKADQPEMELKVNETLTLRGIPRRVQEYRLGNRSALDWVIDQYQIKTDKRSGITHDPNNFNGDERYIVDLVTKIITVSLATVEIVAGLPAFR